MPADIDASNTVVTDTGSVVKGDTVAAFTAAWTSATLVNTSISISTVGMGSVSASINPSGTITGGNISFDASDDGGTTWYPISLSDGFGNIDISPLAATKALVNGNIAPFTNFRARLSTVITGTGTVNVTIQASAIPCTSATNVQQSSASLLKATVTQGPANTIANKWPVQITDGVNVANVGADGALDVDIVAALPAGTNLIGGVNVAQYGGTNTTLGQKAMAASMPIVLPTDQFQKVFTVPDVVAVTNASTQLVAAAAGVDRIVAIMVDPEEVAAVHVNLGAAATTSKWRLAPGKGLIFMTTQQVTAIREASAVANVNVYTMTAV
jgi:hypothetical protein